MKLKETILRSVLAGAVGLFALSARANVVTVIEQTVAGGETAQIA